MNKVKRHLLEMLGSRCNWGVKKEAVTAYLQEPSQSKRRTQKMDTALERRKLAQLDDNRTNHDSRPKQLT